MAIPSRIRFTLWWGCLALVACLVALAVEPAEGAAALQRRRQELRLQLAAERARLMREDPEAAALRERIERLYIQLDAVLQSKPTVQRLQDDMAQIDRALGAAAVAPVAPPPAQGTPGGKP